VGKKSKIEDGKQVESIATAKPKKAASARPRRKKVEPKVKAPSASKPSVPPTSIARIEQPSDDEIRIRAYFIAERRAQLQLEGDSTHDWLEARRQLIDEAGRRAS
jgi:hypothetical protein